MLNGLRAGASLYALYKTEPRVEILEVVSVSNPVPQFPTYTAGLAQPQLSRVVDIQARRGSETVKFEKVPADVTIADFGPSSGIVLSESRDAILAEIETLSKSSERALADEDHHRHVIEECEKMRQTLNPALQKEAENTKRLDTLEQTLNEIRALLRSRDKSKEE